MADWDPQQYLQFKRDRLRPVYDLLSRIAHINPKTVMDLGCGPATSTQILGEQFNKARISGLDNSEAMISKARDKFPAAHYSVGDASKWKPEHRVDLILSNAVFHWLPDHQSLLSRLADNLNPGGTLAVQLPDNMDEPSHLAIEKIASSQRFKKLLEPQFAIRNNPASIGEYYDWLACDFAHIDIWRTSYAHIMPSHGHIVEWMKGAALTPFLSVLDRQMSEEFLVEYHDEILKTYPARKDGKVIFNFPRLFFVAQKSSEFSDCYTK